MRLIDVLRQGWWTCGLILAGFQLQPMEARAADQDEGRWWKGNLHTHSLWSDGDDFPEMIVDWYKKNGYQFLAISDHNVMHQAERWIPATSTNGIRDSAVEKYVAAFGADWVETREEKSEKELKKEVRLKPLGEYRSLFEEAGKFLLISSEELTDKYKSLPVHLNATNLRDHIPPQGGRSVREVMQNNVDAVWLQRRATGQRMLPHLNHPNFHWGITAEDLAWVRGEQFFEVYNGHPDVRNVGDTNHPSTDRLWDIALALRLISDNPEPLYGIGVDDSHNYHKHGLKFSNSGRGWIMVRAKRLTPETLIKAMEEADFYASSGVGLKQVTRGNDVYSIRIDAQEGVTYKTQFVGTRRGFDSRSEPVKNAKGEVLPITRRYGDRVGEVFAEVEGANPQYRLRGNELYVRARIISSKAKENPSIKDEVEMAWTQPVIPPPK